MSGVLPVNEPVVEAGGRQAASVIELVIEARARDLGDGFVVRRLLPSPERQRVGPFIFFDQMGPVTLARGHGLDVRPHPHIALATVTFLFDGEIMHRDSLGSVRGIHPGDVNWMLAGRGITHSERSGEETRRNGQRLHGIQCWVALPTEDEETEPRFEHHPASSIPRLEQDGALLDVVAGSAYGVRSPVGVLSPTLYVHARLPAGAKLEVDREHEERAVYVVEGSIELERRTFGPGTMVVLAPGAEVTLSAIDAARLMLLGGEQLEGERYLFWNFVSSSPERLEQAKRDWVERRFAAVPGDDEEFIPLPG
ncbi:MAG: pirin [Myxococcaceae bacterium]|nr:pirin [Myxococcaceae bacterium]